MAPCGAAVTAAEVVQKLTEMTFERDAHDWQAERNCRAFLQDGVLHIEATTGMPILSRLANRIGGRIEVVAEIRTLAESAVDAYWTTRSTPRRCNENRQTHALIADGQWHEYRFQLPVPDYLTSFSFRFAAVEGIWEIRKITVFRKRPHPITVQKIEPLDYKAPDGNTYPMMRYTIYNDAPVPLDFRVEGQTGHGDEGKHTIAGRGTIDLLAPMKTEGHLAAANVLLHPDEFPSIGFPVFRYIEKGTTDWIVCPLGTPSGPTMGDAPMSGATPILEIAPDARMARIRSGQGGDGEKEDVVAVIAPLVHRQGLIPKFEKISDTQNSEATISTISRELVFESDDTQLTLRIEKGRIHLLLEDKETEKDTVTEKTASEKAPLEGPALRLLGTLRSGLLPGVEFLGPGDVSSSTIDIEAPNNARSTPSPTWVTMPLAVLATERGGLALRWKDMTLQPTFASPNSFDRTDDHRVSLIGPKIEATIDYFAPAPNGESTVLRALRGFAQTDGFPEAPLAPRNVDQQFRLSLQAMRGPLRSEDGLQWGYALEPDWPRKSFADMLSTTVRLLDFVHETKMPRAENIVSGGADMANDTIYFLTGQAEQWRTSRESAIRSILELRNPDGSFLHRTRFPEVERNATSYGYTAIRTLEIMEFARLTGSKELFALVQGSLEYLSDCELPRGGFYRGDPLHTPDLLSAATLTWLYVWAYEFTGDTHYLELAKRFAYLGLPFVYQWQDAQHPIMLYVTVPKFGGTGRQPPLWFGVSQPRVGLVYGYALQLLARHDTNVDWRRVASGILHAAESLQFTKGEVAGCLPQAFDVLNQERRGWHVNPCALTSLRLALDGRPDTLVLFMDGQERYVSPYPLRKKANVIEAYDVPDGRTFQVLRNGNRILPAVGSGPLQGL